MRHGRDDVECNQRSKHFLPTSMMEKIVPKIFFLMFILPCLHAVFRDVVIMDDILTPDNLKSIEILLSSEETQWNFNNLVPHRISSVENSFSIHDRPNYVSPTHYWTTKFKPLALILDSAWCIRIKHQVAMELGVSVTTDFLHVYQISAQISGRGDNTLETNSCSKINFNQEQDIMVIIFSVVRNWNKNCYGEVVVYDNDGEILKSIHPRNGRAVLLDCGYSYTIKPPSMDCTERLHTLTIQFSTSSPYFDKNVMDTSQWLQNTYTHVHLRKLISSLVDTSDDTNLDVAKYITRQFITTKGHPIIVFDNIIPKHILDFFAQLIVNGTYADNPPSPYSNDNVPWILAFDTETVVESPLWKYVQAIAKFASKKDGLYPYDVSCNTLQSYDTTTIHTDCKSDQEEFTLLIYMNKNWTNNDLGETVFFNYNTEHDTTGNEMVFAIKPKFGRVAIFHGTIPHSARPPTPLFHGARYTLAIKLASSKAEAFRKTLELDIEPLETYLEKSSPDDMIEVQRIIDDIRSGKKSQEEIEKIITKYEKKLEEM